MYLLICITKHQSNMSNFDYKKYIAEGRLLKEEFEVGDTVLMRGDQLKGEELTIVSKRRMFGSDLNAYTVKKSNGETAEYDETQLTLSESTSESEGETLSIYPFGNDIFTEALKNLGIENGYELDTFIGMELAEKGIEWEGDPENDGTMMYNIPEEQYSEIKKVVGKMFKRFLPSNFHPVNEGIVTVPMDVSYDLDEEAEFFQGFLDDKGIESTVRVGKGRLDIYFSQYEDKDEIEQTLNNRGYEYNEDRYELDETPLAAPPPA